PRYLMGVGFPRDIVAAVASGVDMFDCVLPTRNGRNAYAFTASGPLRLRNSQFIRDEGPIGHFFFAGEMLGPVLCSVHNIRFYQRLMADLRRAIAGGTFEQFRTTDP